jgi:hypothetical protein
MTRPTYRNHRNNPYMIDDFLGRTNRTAAGVLWRFRTEALTVITTIGGGWLLARSITLAGVLAITIPLLTATLIALAPRRFLTRRILCVMTRHRLQRVCFETRMHTRSGRLPLVLRIHPTEVGEQALIWCRAGICFEDFEAHTGEIAAACYAREVRVERSRRWAQLVTVHVVRRDTLARHNVIVSGLVLRPPNSKKASHDGQGPTARRAHRRPSAERAS